MPLKKPLQKPMIASLLSLVFLFLTPAFGESDAPDQIQRGYSESAPWDVLPGGYYGTFRVASPAGPQSPMKSASWNVALPVAGKEHRLQVTWTADPANASKARYRIFDGKRFLKAVEVNQRQAPHGEHDGKSVFQDLGTFFFQTTTVQIDLTNEADGRVIADAVRVK